MTSRFGKNILMGLFAATMALTSKDSLAQMGMKGDANPDAPNAPNATADVGRNMKLMQNKFDIGGHDMSTINDAPFLLDQDTIGATVTSRAFGLIGKGKDKDASGVDSAMFYKTKAEVNGYKVDGQIALIHDHEQVYPNYEKADKTFAAYNITGPDGKVTSVILNRKSPEMVDGKLVGRFLTTIINPDGKQFLVHLNEDMVDEKLIPAMSNDPEMVLKFAKEVSTKKNKSDFENPRPGYAGQELPGGVFQIISIDGSGFSSVMGTGMTGSVSATEKPKNSTNLGMSFTVK